VGYRFADAQMFQEEATAVAVADHEHPDPPPGSTS